MLAEPSALSPRAAASLLRWWDDAGVDLIVEDEPQSWTNRSTKPAVVADAPPVSVESLPDTLPGLVDWLMTSDRIPAAEDPARRVAPFGTPGAAIMLVTDMPETGDAEAGALFSGEAGALLDRMLAAIGHDRTTVYCAPLCPARTATGRLDDAALPQLAEIAMHHIALVKPERIWIMGQTASRALLGMDDIAARGSIREINCNGATIGAVASLHPRLLLQNPKRKALVWADMQLLVGGRSA
jgi:uracil-DNA glycosylase